MDKVTKEGASDFVPAAERIATFDNDGEPTASRPTLSPGGRRIHASLDGEGVRPSPRTNHGQQHQAQFELREGKPVLMRLPEVNFIDDKSGKPIAIHRHIGRRLIAAFGNSDGDIEMLE